MTADQAKVDTCDKLRDILAGEDRLSIYDVADGKFEILLTNANAVILVCSENLKSSLSNGKEITLTIANDEFQMDCRILQGFIADQKTKGKFISLACEKSHIPDSLLENSHYICADDNSINKADFLRTVRPAIEGL